MNGQYVIQSKDQWRTQLWERLFGLRELPVVTNRARWQDINGRNVYAYDLDLSRLSEYQRYRFAGYIAKRTGRSYTNDVRPEIDSRVTYPVEASGCIVLVEESVSEDETAVQQRRPFLFVLSWLARLFSPRLMYG